MCESIGFIILRHVNTLETDQYWKHCYKCIRKFYPENYILIIDDNSNQEFISNDETLYNTKIINSEYPKRGELLPYIYFISNKLFDTAVIIHDSVFINKYLDFTIEKYKIIWNFEHCFDNVEDETRIINMFDPTLLEFYNNKTQWTGCFGGMTIINHDFLLEINKKYNLEKLLDLISNRGDRCAFERIIACILQKEHKCEILLGNIHTYLNWAVPNYSDINNLTHLPMIKIFCGR